MKMKSLLFLAMSVGCGLIAMVGVRNNMSGDEQDDSVVAVLVTKTDILPGSQLTDTNTELRTVDRESLPPGIVTSRDQVKNRSLKVRAVAGEFVMLAKLGEEGDLGVAADIPAGMRVVTVPVTQTTSHSGLLLPGNRVDVLCTYKARLKNGGNGMKTKILLQYIEVFATDSTRDATATETTEIKSKNVSLLVTPDQGALLMQAQNKGTLHLSLRANSDKEALAETEIDDTLFEDALPPPNWRMRKDAGDEQPQRSEDEIRAALIAEMNAQNDDREPVAEPDVVVRLAPDKWAITIFEGNQKRVEYVEDVTQKTTSAGNGNSDNGRERTSWKGLFEQWFSGA